MSRSIALYVSTTGSDSWSGRLPEPNASATDGPFATLTRARDEARRVKSDSDSVTVVIRGGKYYLDKTFVLTDADSGTTYTAYEDEKPVISGGRRVTGWKPFRDGIWQAELPGTRGGVWKFRDLFMDGNRQTRSRFPKADTPGTMPGGYLVAEGPGEEGSSTQLKYEKGAFPRSWAKPTQGEVFSIEGWFHTFNVTSPIKSMDEQSRVITLARPMKDFDISPWFYPTPIVGGQRYYTGDILTGEVGQRFFVENLLEEVDRPGEWCLDTEDGVLYFYPPDGVDLANAEVVAPYVDRLFDVSGNDITILGLVFTETRRAGEGAHPSGLGAMDGPGAMFSPAEWGYCEEAMRLRRTSRCVIEDCEFINLGGNGIYILGSNRRNILRRNVIRGCGSNGVVLAGARTLKTQPYPEHPLFNEVSDNEISHVGLYDKSAAGVFLGRSESNRIIHNLIHDMPTHGINLGNDGYGRNYIEYNRIHHVCLETWDTAAINVWMEAPREGERSGHFIRCNFISDVAVGNPQLSKYPYVFSGIYLDNECSNCYVYGNIIARSPIGMYIKGKNNVIENNIIYHVRSRPDFRTTGLRLSESYFYASYPEGDSFVMSQHIARNIFCCLDSMITVWGPVGLDRAIEICDDNIYFNTDGVVFRYGYNAEGGKEFFRGEPMESLEAWRETTGFDTHSIQADPKLADPDNDDLALQAASPALELGFVPIDMSKIGIRGGKPYRAARHADGEYPRAQSGDQK